MAKNVTVAQLNGLLGINENSIIKIFMNKIENLKSKVTRIQEEIKELKREVKEL